MLGWVMEPDACDFPLNHITEWIRFNSIEDAKVSVGCIDAVDIVGEPSHILGNICGFKSR